MYVMYWLGVGLARAGNTPKPGPESEFRARRFYIIAPGKGRFLMSFWSWLSGESESQSSRVHVPGGRYVGQTETDRAIQSAFGREHVLYRKDWLGRIRTMDGRTYKLHQNSDGSYTAEER